MSTDLCLGVARKIITPKVGALLCGYAPDTVSTSVHDDLRATAFYFCKEDVQALLMSIDVCSINTALCNELRDEIEKKYGILRGNCIIHTIHNHSGPNLTGQFGWGDIDREYYESIFRPTVLATVEESMRAPVSVKMGVATGESLIGINRRELKAENRARLGQNPCGPFDPKMTVISFKDGDGKCVANMIHYGMHGTCAGKNTEISRDWSGVMVDEIENVSGGITAFINGPEGDVGPRLSNGYTTGKGDIRYAERHGAIAAQDAYRIYRSLCRLISEFLLMTQKKDTRNFAAIRSISMRLRLNILKDR